MKNSVNKNGGRFVLDKVEIGVKKLKGLCYSSSWNRTIVLVYFNFEVISMHSEEIN